MDDLLNDIDFENETNNNFIDDELEPEIISDDEENKDSDEKVDCNPEKDGAQIPFFSTLIGRI